MAQVLCFPLFSKVHLSHAHSGSLFDDDDDDDDRIRKMGAGTDEAADGRSGSSRRCRRGRGSSTASPPSAMAALEDGGATTARGGACPATGGAEGRGGSSRTAGVLSTPSSISASASAVASLLLSSSSSLSLLLSSSARSLNLGGAVILMPCIRAFSSEAADRTSSGRANSASGAALRRATEVASLSILSMLDCIPLLSGQSLESDSDRSDSAPSLWAEKGLFDPMEGRAEFVSFSQTSDSSFSIISWPI